MVDREVYPGSWLGEPRPGEAPIVVQEAPLTLPPMQGLPGDWRASEAIVDANPDRLVMWAIPHESIVRLKVAFGV